jgi:hypothetical protein
LIVMSFFFLASFPCKLQLIWTQKLDIFDVYLRNKRL